MAPILDERHPGDLLIAALRVCGSVLLIHKISHEGMARVSEP